MCKNFALKFQAIAEKTAKDARGLLYFAAPCTLLRDSVTDMHCHVSCNLIKFDYGKFVIMFYCYYATIIMMNKDLHNYTLHSLWA